MITPPPAPDPLGMLFDIKDILANLLTQVAIQNVILRAIAIDQGAELPDEIDDLMFEATP